MEITKTIHQILSNQHSHRFYSHLTLKTSLNGIILYGVDNIPITLQRALLKPEIYI